MKAGDIVLIPIPFTDQSSTKKRPCLILKYDQDQQDCIVFPITSRTNLKTHIIPLIPKCFVESILPKTSVVKINKIFTLHKKLILRKITSVSFQTLQHVLDTFIEYIQEKVEK